jgi:hypothetical protein
MPVVHPTTSQLAIPSEVTPFSYWSIKPWFLTEENLLMCSSYLSLWVSQLQNLHNIKAQRQNGRSKPVGVQTVKKFYKSLKSSYLD